MEFSQKLVYVRAKLNLSQTELAKALNVTYVTVCRWECEKAKPTKKAEFAFEQYCQEHDIDFTRS